MTPSDAVSIAQGERLEQQVDDPSWAATASSSQDVLPAISLIQRRRGFGPDWTATFRRRVEELARLPEGWDSYGAAPLALRAVATMSAALRACDPYIQSPPMVSMTVDGGLLCQWESVEASLQLTAMPDGNVEIYYCDAGTGEEIEGPIGRDLEVVSKLVWRASLR